MLSLSAAITLAILTAGGQQPANTPPPPPAGAPADQDTATPSDRAVDPSEPDFTLVGLPTTLRMPRFASAFRVTHRFNRALGSGDFGDVASDLFGFDSGAQIGLEYRFGIIDGTQIGIHRTSDRTIEFFGQHQVLRQGTDRLVGVDALVAVEGANNFRQRYSPSIGAVVSHRLGRHGAVYFQPIWVGNSNPVEDSGQDDSTLLLGFGGRFRVRPTVYLVGEAAPRVGYRPGATYASFAIEKRAGGHSFQLNFSNGNGTTFSQIAKGGSSSDWFIGFNISRKFF